MRLRIRLFSVLILLLCGRLQAAEQWTKVTSANFELLTPASEKRGREAILYFEQVRSFFDTLQKVTPTTTPVRVILFQSEKQYNPYRPSSAADAFYVGDDDREYIVLRSAGLENFPIAIHEYTHLIVKRTGIHLPIWMNEGFAELCSTLQPVAGKAQIGAVIPGRYYTLQQNKWLDLRTLTAVDHDSPLYNERDRAGVFYAESWALTHMLYLADQYRPGLPKFLPAIDTTKSTETAFWQVYGKTLDQVQKDLVNYMRNDRFKAFLFDTKLAKAAERPVATPIPSSEANLALAELLALSDKRAQAREMYAQAARENPDNWRVEQALAKLAWRDRNQDEGRKHFARAVELGCTDAKTHLAYASLLQESGAEAQVIVPVLRKALELKPDLVDARMMLGYVEMQAEHYREALEALRRISKVTPDQAFSYFHAIAYASLQLGDRKEARLAAERAQKFAHEPAESAAAAGLLRFLEQTEKDGSVVIKAAERPRLASTQMAVSEAPPVPVPQAGARRVEGILQQVICVGGSANFQLLAEGRKLAFAVQDPKAVVVKNASAGTADFDCGPQKRRVMLEYRDPPAGADVDGIITAIEFR